MGGEGGRWWWLDRPPPTALGRDEGEGTCKVVEDMKLVVVKSARWGGDIKMAAARRKSGRWCGDGWRVVVVGGGGVIGKHLTGPRAW